MKTSLQFLIPMTGTRIGLRFVFLHFFCVCRYSGVGKVLQLAVRNAD